MKIKIGKVLKAQGIKGELKASCTLDNASMLKGVKQMYLCNTPHNVVKLRADGMFFYVLLEGIDDRNAAESYRDWDLFCNKEDISLSDGKYFIDDVLGCRVVLDNGKTVGEVAQVLQYGAADVYVCKNGENEISFPFLKDLVLSVDILSKNIVLCAKRFAEVAVSDED